MSPLEVYLVVLQWAVYLSGYPMPDALPEIRYIDEVEMQEMVCPKTMNCPVAGVYSDGVVYLDSWADVTTNPYHRSILAHELVHYLQQLDSPEEPSCVEANQREIEAYGIQNAYLTQVEGSTLHVTYRGRTCND